MACQRRLVWCFRLGPMPSASGSSGREELQLFAILSPRSTAAGERRHATPSAEIVSTRDDGPREGGVARLTMRSTNLCMCGRSLAKGVISCYCDRCYYYCRLGERDRDRRPPLLSLKIASSLELLLGVSTPWRFCLICPDRRCRCHPLSLASVRLSPPGSNKQSSPLHSPLPRLAYTLHSTSECIRERRSILSRVVEFCGVGAAIATGAAASRPAKGESGENKVSTPAQLYRTHHRSAGIGTGRASRAARRRSGALD